MACPYKSVPCVLLGSSLLVYVVINGLELDPQL